MTHQERLALLYLFVLLCGFFQANNWSLEIERSVSDER